MDMQNSRFGVYPMDERNDRSQRLLKTLFELFKDESSLHFSDFIEVSESFIKGYSRFEKLGMPGKTVCLAMLGATLNMFNMLGMADELPHLLRHLADEIEDEGTVH